MENIIENKVKYSGLLSAVGDAIGWEYEFSRSRNLSSVIKSQWLSNPDFHEWIYVSHNRYMPFKYKVGKGEYSDDTQLMLAVSRSISPNGFNPICFALELAMWKDYKRGGGRAISNASRSYRKYRKNVYEILRKNLQDKKFLNAGANGVAMRNLPIVVFHLDDEKIIRDTILNGILTHAHPRAIIGAILYSYIIKNLIFLNMDNFEFNNFIKTIIDYLKDALATMKKLFSDRYKTTLDNNDNNGYFFKIISEYLSRKEVWYGYIKTVEEVEHYLVKNNLINHLDKSPEIYLNSIGAIGKYKGSGTSSVVAALYFFLRNIHNPLKGIVEAATFIGIDTDTVASFTGAMFGAFHGENIGDDLLNLSSKVQDSEYIKSQFEKLYKKRNRICDINVHNYGNFLRMHEEFISEIFSTSLPTKKHPIFGKAKSNVSIQAENIIVHHISSEIGQTFYFYRINK